jgi:hypothetical protein
MNGVSKRKRPEIELSEPEWTESDDVEFISQSGRTANPLTELTKLVVTLKEIINNQTNFIENIQTDLTEIKAEQQNLKKQNVELQGQVRHLQAQISAARSASPPSTQPWPSIAATRGGGDSTQQTTDDGIYTGAKYPPTVSAKTDALYCTIDISRVAEEDADKVSAGAIRTVIEKEIRTTEGQANWRCRAVIRDAKNRSRIKIACRNDVEHQMVKHAAETNIAPGARVLREELHPVKVNFVNRLAVLEENGEVQVGAAEALGHENETTIAKIAWLSNKNTPKEQGSMVVYVTKSSDAKRLLMDGFFHAGGESGRTAEFKRNFGPLQCYRCQELDHKQFECKNVERCARCAKEGHHHNSCSEAVMKCIPCGGPHESFSKKCPKLYPTQHG